MRVRIQQKFSVLSSCKLIRAVLSSFMELITCWVRRRRNRYSIHPRVILWHRLARKNRTASNKRRQSTPSSYNNEVLDGDHVPWLRIFRDILTISILSNIYLHGTIASFLCCVTYVLVVVVGCCLHVVSDVCSQLGTSGKITVAFFKGKTSR